MSRFLGKGHYGIHLQLAGTQKFTVDGVSGALPPLSCSLLAYPEGKIIESVISNLGGPLTHICLVFSAQFLQEKFQLNERQLSSLLSSSRESTSEPYIAQQVATIAMQQIGYDLLNLNLSPYTTRLYAEAKALELIAVYLDVIRKAINNRKLFPNDDSAMKVVFLAIEAASKRWTMPIRNWHAAMNRFMIEFPDRIPVGI
jgi:hypothetical protein